MTATSAGSDQPTRAGLLYSRCPVVPTISGIAAQLGWLDEEAAAERDLNILVQQQQGEHLAEDPAPHRERYWLRHSGNTKAIWARSLGTDSRVIGLSWARTPNQILTLPSSGIRTVADLKGRRLAIVSHSKALIDMGRASALRTYEVALATAGLTLDDVQLVEVGVEKPYGDFQSSSGRDGSALWTLRRVGQREFITPILRGQADAIAVRGSFASELGTIFGTHVVYDLADNPDRAQTAADAPPFTLVASRALIEERPDLLGRILVRLVTAARWANQKPTEALQLMGQDLGHIAETVRVAFGTELATQLSLNLDESNISALQSHESFLFRHGFLQKHVDVPEWVDPAPLRRALDTIARGV
jgi:ABC-type nitrate/sulfonate/bicarbonate transport system substrate-binding protein